MRVKETPQKNGRVNVAIIEKYWDSTTKTSRQRTVQGLGYLDALDKKHGDGRAWARALCDSLNADKDSAEAAVGLTIHPMERIGRREDAHKNIGCAIALSYYDALGIERCLRNHARGRGFAYDENAVMRLLVCERMVAPSSKLSAWARRGHYFFRSEFSDDDVYRALDFFASVKDAVVSAMNRGIEKMHERNLTDAYYDVTNYYFEIDEQDALRKNGVSKEHRRKPIVQMGLMQDRDGIPIAFNIHPGNTHDSDTMLPAMAQAKRDVKAGRMVVVADKGLNTSTNIAAITLDGNGFVFSQSIKGTKSSAELREWVLAKTGWRTKPDEDGGANFKIKSRQDTKTVHIKDENGKKVDCDIEVKTVAFWSSKYDKRAKYERSKVLEKAQALVKDPSSYDRATHYGAARYVKGVTFDKKTGEIIECAGQKPCIDEDYIAETERTDGYYVIITSEYGLADDKIIEIYRGLWRIEEAFKVTKSYLSARPVFVWTPAHILAHFLICYIALVIVRCIQYDTGYAIGAAVVIDEIRNMCGVRLEDNWWHFYHRTDASDELCRMAGIDLTRRYMRLSDVKKVLAQARGR